MIKAYVCGTKVKTKIGEFDGIITCFQIRWDKVTYEITYCVAGEIKTIWLLEQEFTLDKKKAEQIGFKTE